MLLSNLVQLPLIFISGVFIPIDQLPDWGKIIAVFSRIRHCFLHVEIWQRRDGMSRKESTQHLVVQRMRPDRRGKLPLIERHIINALWAYCMKRGILGRI